MELINGITKVVNSDCVLYYVESLSEEFKNEMRKRLSAICHGIDQAESGRLVYSYKETVKEFIRRYRTQNDKSEDRKKGMIGELLVHMVFELEGRFTAASPFFNIEERSFKKGYDVVLLEHTTNELWIAEVKSGEKQKQQKNSSSAITGLLNTAKNDLKGRLNDQNSALWLNAINAATISMSRSHSQKDAVLKILQDCADDSITGTLKSTSFNVILSGALFNDMTDRMESNAAIKKQKSVEKENLFKKVFIVAIQKGTFSAVVDFLESEAESQ